MDNSSNHHFHFPVSHLIWFSGWGCEVRRADKTITVVFPNLQMRKMSLTKVK